MKMWLRGILVLGLAALVFDGVALGQNNRAKGPNPNEALQRAREMQKRLDEFQKRMEKMLEEAMKQGGIPGGLGGFPGMPGLPGLGQGEAGPSAQEARLGATVSLPSATMIDQLDLPKNQGMILDDVGANSPASKVGLKVHDILLEVNGKAVPSNKSEFDKVLSEVKADKAVEVVVMRKGRKETLKGLKLPEAKEAKQPLRGGLFPRLPGGLGDGAQGGTTTVTRNNDEFTAKHKGDGGTVIVRGKVNQGKAVPSEIAIEVDGKTTKYADVDKVPAEHQAMVKKLLTMSGGKGKPRSDDEF